MAIDRTISTDELLPGSSPAITQAIVTAGGKGVNVARATRALGLDATLVGLLPGEMGQAVAGLLADEGIRLLGVPVGGELRSAMIIHENSGRATVLNEPGPEIAADDWLAYENAAVEALDDHRVAVCSGSLPPGARDDAYARIVTAAHERRRKVVVDAGGRVLLCALSEGPDVVCPNLAEAETALFGIAAEAVEAPSDARDRSVVAARALVERGAMAAIVTAASAGAAVAEAGNPTARWISAPVVTVANPMGAGDAFAAGLAVGLMHDLELDEAALRAVAVGSASVEHPRAGWLDLDRVDALVRSMHVRSAG